MSRTLAAVLCLAGVGAVYAAGRALWDRRTGLLAAAVLCFAFLPVAFSRMALTDTGTLAPVAVALWLSIRMAEGAGLRTAALAGVAVGLAIGFKYTAGLILLAPVLALPLRRDGAYALRGGLAVLAGALVAFAFTNPFFFLDFDRALHQLRGQAELAGNQGKFGQEDETGVLYYLDSLLWGLGYVAAAASLAGAVLLARRDRARARCCSSSRGAVPVPELPDRFFGRWLLPAYPVSACSRATASSRWRRRCARARAPLSSPSVGAFALRPGLLGSVHMDRVLGGRTRGRRRWLAEREHARGREVIVEPFVPPEWAGGVRQVAPVTATAVPGLREATCRCTTSRTTQRGMRVDVRSTQKERSLKAGLRWARATSTPRSTTPERRRSHSPLSRRRRPGRVLLRLLVQLRARARTCGPGPWSSPPAGGLPVSAAAIMTRRACP